MSKYEDENRAYGWILTGIDVFSRYFFAIPLRRKHKEFTVNAVKRLLEQFETRFGQLPRVIQMDEGGEFKNTKVLPFQEERVSSTFLRDLLPKRRPSWKEQTGRLKRGCGNFLTTKVKKSGFTSWRVCGKEWTKVWTEPLEWHPWASLPRTRNSYSPNFMVILLNWNNPLTR